MIRKLIGAGAVAVLALGSMIPSAQAHEVSVFVGTASVPGGLWLLGVGPARASTWDVSTTIAAPAAVDGSGNLSGNCGLSTGSGSASIGSHANFAVTFTSLGGTVILTANAGAGGAVAQARPLPAGAGDVPCVTSLATNFTIVGAAADAL
jgi:hypothetical protein